MTAATWRFAHRGAHLELVENTLPAFAEAFAAGCDGVEFDVQLSRDGIPVIFHDDDLNRLAGRRESLCDWDESSLRGLALRQNGATAFLPTLDEFLGRFGSRRFYLELKVPQAKQKDQAYLDALATACLRALSSAKPHPETFLASFHLPLMERLQRENRFPNLGAIYEDEVQFAEVMALPDRHALRRLRYHSLEYAIWLRRHEAGLPLPDPGRILVWGIHGETAFAKAAQAGLAGVVADDVAGMLRVIKKG